MTHRAITPEQKRAVVERILAVWEKNPELRLGKMFLDVTTGIDNDHTVGKMYFIEDEDLAERMELLLVPFE